MARIVCDSCFVDGVKGVRELWGEYGERKGEREREEEGRKKRRKIER